ncbi:restriction endonuclease subunit S [Reichenbachiella sp.]|uniref:restriction endonuclease subunit S n=1 Tax=Reichenbachiella sp. TaxID=2184521 RepID=UPI003B58B9DB
MLYKEGFSLLPIGELITRNKEKEIIEDDGLYKQVTIKLYGKGVIQRGNDLIVGKTIGTKNQYRVSNGQFIMSKIDARNGAFGIVPEELEGAITTQDFLSYNINEDVILPQFFVLITASKRFNELCQKASSGTTGRQRVNEKEFLGFTIPVPSKTLQLEILSNYNSKILEANQLYQKANHLEIESTAFFLKKLSLPPLGRVKVKKRFELFKYKDLERWDVFSSDNAIYNELKNSKNQVQCLGDYFSFTKRAWSKKIETKEYFDYIEIGGVDPLFGIKESTKTLTKKAPSRASQTVKENDLIIGTTRPYLKRFAIVGNQHDGQVCSSGFSVIEPKSNYNLSFLKIYLMSDYGIEQLKNQMSGALYPAITISKLKDILIPIPPKKDQDLIVSKVEAMKSDAMQFLKKSEHLRETALNEFESEIFY